MAVRMIMRQDRDRGIIPQGLLQRQAHIDFRGVDAALENGGAVEHLSAVIHGQQHHCLILQAQKLRQNILPHLMDTIQHRAEAELVLIVAM